VNLDQQEQDALNRAEVELADLAVWREEIALVKSAPANRIGFEELEWALRCERLLVEIDRLRRVHRMHEENHRNIVARLMQE
jgi:hypothetical protein